MVVGHFKQEQTRHSKVCYMHTCGLLVKWKARPHFSAKACFVDAKSVIQIFSLRTRQRTVGTLVALELKKGFFYNIL
jgi:hypothetical protein